MTIRSDYALLQLVQIGNQPALVALYDRYARLVYSTALRVLKNPMSAEDVTQELFLRLWDRADRIQVTGETLHGWMVTASRNRSIDILRKRSPEPLDDLILVAKSNSSSLTECRLMCELALGLMRTDQRMVVEMAYLRGLTHSEIASIMGWPLGTVKTVIRRALLSAKDALETRSYSLEKVIA